MIALVAGVAAGLVAGLITVLAVALLLRPFARDLANLDHRLHEVESLLGVDQAEPEPLRIEEWYMQREDNP